MAAALQEGVLRRQLRAELAATRDFIERDLRARQPGWRDDEMSLNMRAWVDGFDRSLARNADADAALRAHLVALALFLHDPLFHYSLRPEDARLGSDGRTYSQLVLDVHRLTIGEMFRNRPPLDPELDVVFNTQPHRIVTYMIQHWLQRRGDYQPPRELEQLHDLLHQEDQARRQIFEFEQVANAALIQRGRLEGLDVGFRAAEEARLREFGEMLRAMRAGPIARMEAVVQRHAEQMNALREQDQAAVHALQGRVDRFEGEQQARREHVVQIEAQIAANQQGIAIVNQAQAAVDVSIAELSVRIEKAQNDALKAILKTVVIIAACYCATLMLQQAFAMAGSTAQATVYPTQGGAGLRTVVRVG